jgi:hypothetical protein
MALQNVRIALTATDDTKAAQAGVDALESKIDQLAAAWKSMADAAAKANEPVKQQAGLVNGLKQRITELAAARDRSFNPTAIQRFNDKIKETEKEIQKLTSSTEKQSNALKKQESSLKSVGAAVVAYFAVDQLKEFATRVIQVTSEFQKYEAVLTNTLGSNTAAQIAQQKVADAAAKTNFSVQQLTDTYVKFANRGVKLTQTELLKLADIANSTGKSIDQLTEAALDSFTGENERLKEFGITAKKTGDTTQFTFKGITTEVKNTQEAVKEYILSLGDLQGVSGSTAAISKTLEGQISNFGDALDQLFVTIGKGSAGPFSFLLGQLTQYVNFVKQALTSTEEWNNQIANTRADRFIEDFKKMGEGVQKGYVDQINRAIAAQEFLIARAEAARKRPGFENNRGVRTEDTVDEKGAEQKRLELALATNKKKLDLITGYYKDKKKEDEKAGDDELGLLKELQDKITALQKEQLESRSKARIAAITKEIEDVKVQIEQLLNPRQKTRIEATIDLSTEEVDEIKQKAQSALDAIDPLKVPAKLESLIPSATDQYDKLTDLEKKHTDRLNEIRDIAAEADKERLQKVKEYREALQEEEIETAAQFVNALFEINAQQNQKSLEENDIKRKEELKRVGDDKQAQSFINDKFDKKQADIKRKQAIADKASALFGIGINTALAIIKQLSVTPLPIGAPFVALIAAAGAIQAAVVAARPIPKYAKGTEYLKRTNGEPAGTDTILMYGDEGERLVPKAINSSLMGIPNAELPRLADIYRNGGTSSLHMKELLAATKETTQAIKRMKVYSTEIKESGLIRVVETNTSKTKILNEQFSI